jgi:lipoate-protein ligase A
LFFSAKARGKRILKTWDLIIDRAPLKGSLNMAIDEYLFKSLDQRSGTCVRFYRWEKPTASLGYAQTAAKILDVDYCRDHGVEIVRRLTGGKLVLHHREVTYSFVSDDIGAFGSTLSESYRLISRALMNGLEKMGLEPALARSTSPSYIKSQLPCFSQPARDEVEIGGKKIVGSAQKRVGPKFLQHGSIPLEEEEALLKSISPRGRDLELRLTSLSRVLGTKVDFDWAVERLGVGVAEFFGIHFRPRSLSAEEMAAVLRIQGERYENEAWTFRANSGAGVDFA